MSLKLGETNISDAFRYRGTEPIIIHAESHRTVEGYEVPVLTDEQLVAAYNGMVAGENVFIVDDLDTITIQVLDASSIDGVSIRLLFTDKLILTYKEERVIEANKIDVDFVQTISATADVSAQDKAVSEKGLAQYIASGNDGAPRTFTSIDLNSITATGFYYCDTCTNRPVNANGVMVVSRYSGGNAYVMQEYFAFAENKVFVRFRNNNTWGSWRELLTADDRIQFTTLPTASADNVGAIVQYTGTTTSTYTNGHFYKCVSDGASTPTYSWAEVSFGGVDNGFYILYTDQYITGYLGTSQFLSDIKDIFNIIRTTNKMKPILISSTSSTGPSGSMIFEIADTRFYTLDNTDVYAQLCSFHINPGTYQNGKYSQTVIQINLNVYIENGIITSIENKGINSMPQLDIVGVNNSSYVWTPSSNYNIANKKYVDDAITTAIGTAIERGY